MSTVIALRSSTLSRHTAWAEDFVSQVAQPHLEGGATYHPRWPATANKTKCRIASGLAEGLNLVECSMGVIGCKTVGVALLFLMSLAVLPACAEDSPPPTTISIEATPTLSPVDHALGAPFAKWNNVESQPWWRDSEPYSCAVAEKTASPWVRAGLTDLGGGDPLSLIRYYGNGSYLRYGNMDFEGCTPIDKYPDHTHHDPPIDPTYFSLGNIDIHVDIARGATGAEGLDEGVRAKMSMEEAVDLLNAHVATYYRRVSEGRFRITFQAGNDFPVGGDGTLWAARDTVIESIAGCWITLPGCRDFGMPGGLSRILLNDIPFLGYAYASNTWGEFSLALLDQGRMDTIVHEIGHGWMGWPHSFTELPWSVKPVNRLELPNHYSNWFDVMSGLANGSAMPWEHPPPTLAINRYSAGWISPDRVALHLVDDGVYTIGKPYTEGRQFVVVHSGRQGAFTTLEVTPDYPSGYMYLLPDQVWDPSGDEDRRSFRYDGVLVSRYDQTTGTGVNARFGPALYDPRNPGAIYDVGEARDDYSLISDGEIRDIGGGVTVSASKNEDGSYNVMVSGGRVARFEPWCMPFWLTESTTEPEYDTGCVLDGVQFGSPPS